MKMVITLEDVDGLVDIHGTVHEDDNDDEMLVTPAQQVYELLNTFLRTLGTDSGEQLRTVVQALADYEMIYLEQEYAAQEGETKLN